MAIRPSHSSETGFLLFRDMPKLSLIISVSAALMFLALVDVTATTSATAAPEHGPRIRSMILAMTIEEGHGQNTPSGEPQPDSPESGPKTTTGNVYPPPKPELVAGGIRAKLNLAVAGTQFSAGSTAFAEITLSNISSAKQMNAEIVFETELASIIDVSASKIKIADAGNQKIASVAGLRKGKPRKVTVELRLRAGEPGQDPLSETTNSLKITLRPKGGGDVSDSTIVTWPVSDCAGAFYSRILSIREQNSDRMGSALKTAWRGDSRRPGRWLFRPPSSASASKRKCARWTRRWDSRYGRYRSRCIRYRSVRSPRATGAKMTKNERAVVRFAAKYVRTRARDPQLSVKQHYGWVSQRVATDLRGFLKQDKHPAICSGAVELADYFTDRMGDVSKRAGIFEENSKKAHSLAAAKIAEIRDVVQAEPGGHPGWGQAPLSITLAGSDRTLRQLVTDVAELAGDDAPVATIRQAGDAFAALKIMRGYTSDGGLKPLAAEVRSAILHALSLIEAADYISSVHHHYSELDQSIIGSLTAMKKAHGQHCTCGR